MKSFGTSGRVYPEKNYVVLRTDETTDFINRIKEGKYIALFAPRQTGKTTFFRLALKSLTKEDTNYIPIQLDFQTMREATPTTFYDELHYRICMQITNVIQQLDYRSLDNINLFLANTRITDHLSMVRFFQQLQSLLDNESHTPNIIRVVLLIDEFDGIPQSVVSNFLYSLRQIYLSDEMKCPHSVGIVGVKSIAQLEYDRSISPFNIQAEFRLHNFTLKQVEELYSQYIRETDQNIDSELIEYIHKQTAGQPFLVNRLGQILTEELKIPKTQQLNMQHFAKAYTILIEEDNTNLSHLITNVRKDRRYEHLLMNILSSDEGVRFNLRNELINELTTFGVIKKDGDGMCEIVNPIYLYCIIQAFKPAVNGLESDYFDEDNINGFHAYLNASGQVDLERVLDNFRDFIARAGYRILQISDTPQEYIGQHLLLTYLEPFVHIIGAGMYIEVQTGRGKIDLLISHNQKRYVIEIKIWRGEVRYQAGKRQLAAYINTENALEGYYIVFDHRKEPIQQKEKERIDGASIQSYIIPVIQQQPSSMSI